LLVQTGFGQDVKPPNVLSFDFDPKAFDTSTSSREITFTARLTDDLSGVSGNSGGFPSQAQFRSPSGNQFETVIFWPPENLISGDELDGIYESSMTLPQHSESGTWQLHHFSLYDNVGNRRELDRDDMIALGFPTDFQVLSIGDTEPPNVLSFDFDPKAVDTSTSSREITFTARLTDDLSGVSGNSGGFPSQAQFRSPSGNQFETVIFWPPENLISGDELDGIYESSMTLPQHSESGTWQLHHFSLYDNVGNRRELDRDDMIALGFPTDFQVLSIGDTEPPNVLSFDFDPKAVDTSTSSREITFTARLTDDLSGVSGNSGGFPSQAQFRSPSGNQFETVIFWPPENLISGDELDGIYESSMTLPQHSESGTWQLHHFSLYDNVGNRRELDRDDMIALGLPATFRNAHSGMLSISGMKFNDLNNNCAKDAGESGLPGWKIELLLNGNVIDTIETPLDGTYSFDHLAPGSYTVREVQQAGWVQTYPPGGSHLVNLVDADSTGNDFGNHQIESMDVEPPNVLGFNFDPKSVYTSTSSKDITFTARLADDLSGIGMSDDFVSYWSGASFHSPSGGQRVSVSFHQNDRVSGTDLDGIYESKINLPRYSEKGTWKLDYVSISDRVGNTKRLNKDEMIDLSFPTEFEVESIGDVTPPNILEFGFYPKSVDTSTSSKDITFTARLTDDLSGIGMSDDFVSYWSGASFHSPSGGQRVSVSFHQNDRVSGTDLDGIYESKINLPRYSEKGTWKLDYVSISDRVGNTKRLNKDEMIDLSFPTEFEVESIGDVTPPNILEFGFDPKSVDTSTSSKDITFTARLTDDLSGIGMSDDFVSYWSGASFHSPSGGQRVSVSFHQNDRVSGMDLDGIYESKINLPRYSEKGTWKLDYVSISDRVGNTKRLNKDDMTTLGFPTEFQNDPSYNPPAGLSIEKTASSSTVSPGDLLNYTIIYTNTGDARLTEVVITESYPEGVDFVSASPAPDHGTNNRWTIGDLPPGDPGKITVVVRVPELQDFEFSGEGMITGTGFVNVRKSLSTSRGPLDLKNVVTITSAETGPASASASVTITDPGTELSTHEHGSGFYESGEVVQVRTENKSISMEKDVAATFSPTTIGLYNDRVIEYSSRWAEEARAKNRVTGTSMTESYRYATSIDRESRIFLDENESVMEVNSDFDGRGHIGFLKMPSGASSPRSTPIFEAREDYVGSFRVLERIDEYGSIVSSDKAAAGQGLVIVDKRVGSSQRTYESGTGTYDSEELIRTSINYIAKDISLVHAPMSQRLTESTFIDASMKWKEGMSSTNPRTSYIGEEYTSITELDKETVARGLNEMETDAEFSGQARFRAILDTSQGGRDPEIDFDEQYSGDYSIQRRVHFSGVAKYDRPHLNVTKTLNRVYVETLPWDYGEPHLEGAIKTRRVADYTIRIENDGNRVLQPVYVQDRFPPGATFIEPSSIRPSELTDSYANWTLTHLSIGGAVNISLSLDVSKCYSASYPPEMVNRVEACGVYDDEQVCASNFSALEIKWLTCCIDEPVAIAKTAEIDPANPRVVLYRINLSNNDDAIRVATVTDRLPAGMSLIEASVPFASYDGDVIVWKIMEIGPFETKTIEFSALASADGRFTNVVEVDPRSVEGTVVGPVRAACVIDVGVVEGECDPIGCGIWQPPNWQFDQVGYQPDVMNCELLTAAGCVGTGSCLAP
jgi:uncharacterized repeat protein (TIGR01451 family)